MSKKVLFLGKHIALLLTGLIISPLSSIADNNAVTAGSVGASSLSQGPTALSSFKSSMALPKLGKVHHGSVNVTAGKYPNSVKISTGKGVNAADFNGFNVGSKARVDISQGSHASMSIFRDVSGQTSRINGMLKVDKGTVYLTNKEGLIFGKNAIVDVSKFIGIAGTIDPKAFVEGDRHFKLTGDIENNAKFKVADNGVLGLLGHSVTQKGFVEGREATYAYASAGEVWVDFEEDSLVGFKVQKPGQGGGIDIQKGARLETDGGSVYMMTVDNVEAAVRDCLRVDGDIDASTAYKDKAGNIVLDAGQGRLHVSGNLSTEGQEAGNITLKGADIDVAKTATLDASGYSKAGEISIGGRRLISGSSLLDLAMAPLEKDIAKRVHVAEGAKILAQREGDGPQAGRIFLIAQDKLDFKGTADVQSFGRGPGGMIEASQIKGDFSFSDLPLDRISYKNHGVGPAGRFLLDPTNFTIDSSAAAEINSGLSSGDVIVSVTDTLTVDSDIAWSTKNALLLAATGASGNLVFNADLTMGGTGNLLLYQGSATAPSGAGTVSSTRTDGNYVLWSVPSGSGRSSGDINVGSNVTAFLVDQITNSTPTNITPGHYTVPVTAASHTEQAPTGDAAVTSFDISVNDTFNSLTGAFEGIHTGGTIGQNTITIGDAGGSNPLWGVISGGNLIAHAKFNFAGTIDRSAVVDSGDQKTGALVRHNDADAGASDLFIDRVSVNEGGTITINAVQYIGALVGYNTSSASDRGFLSITNSVVGDIDITGTKGQIGGIIGDSIGGGSTNSRLFVDGIETGNVTMSLGSSYNHGYFIGLFNVRSEASVNNVTMGNISMTGDSLRMGFGGAAISPSSTVVNGFTAGEITMSGSGSQIALLAGYYDTGGTTPSPVVFKDYRIDKITFSNNASSIFYGTPGVSTPPIILQGGFSVLDMDNAIFDHAKVDWSGVTHGTVSGQLSTLPTAHIDSIPNGVYLRFNDAGANYFYQWQGDYLYYNGSSYDGSLTSGVPMVVKDGSDNILMKLIFSEDDGVVPYDIVQFKNSEGGYDTYTYQDTSSATSNYAIDGGVTTEYTTDRTYSDVSIPDTSANETDGEGGFTFEPTVGWIADFSGGGSSSEVQDAIPGGSILKPATEYGIIYDDATEQWQALVETSAGVTEGVSDPISNGYAYDSDNNQWIATVQGEDENNVNTTEPYTSGYTYDSTAGTWKADLSGELDPGTNVTEPYSNGFAREGGEWVAVLQDDTTTSTPVTDGYRYNSAQGIWEVYVEDTAAEEAAGSEAGNETNQAGDTGSTGTGGDLGGVGDTETGSYEEAGGDTTDTGDGEVTDGSGTEESSEESTGESSEESSEESTEEEEKEKKEAEEGGDGTTDEGGTTGDGTSGGDGAGEDVTTGDDTTGGDTAGGDTGGDGTSGGDGAGEDVTTGDDTTGGDTAGGDTGGDGTSGGDGAGEDVTTGDDTTGDNGNNNKNNAGKEKSEKRNQSNRSRSEVSERDLPLDIDEDIRESTEDFDFDDYSKLDFEPDELDSQESGQENEIFKNFDGIDSEDLDKKKKNKLK